MDLSAYLSQKKLTAAKFAKIIGVHRTSVARFCDKTRRPDLDTLEKIHKATNGKVKAEDFFSDVVSPSREAQQ